MICLGPSDGPETTYTRVDAWSRGFRDPGQSLAEPELARRYLRCFAPASPHDFAVWSGMRNGDAEEIWDKISDDILPVNLAGNRAWVLRADLSTIKSASLPELSIRLLPHFDSFLLGHRDHGNVVQRSHHARVYRNQGWVSPVLLLNGRAAGIWECSRERERLTVRVRPFGRLPPGAPNLVREEAELLASFFGRDGAKTLIGAAR